MLRTIESADESELAEESVLKITTKNKINVNVTEVGAQTLEMPHADTVRHCINIFTYVNTDS